MSNRVAIPKSFIPIQIQTGIVGLVALLLFLTTSRIVRLIDDFVPTDIDTLAFIIRVIALVVAVGAVYVTWKRENQQKYYLEGSSLIVETSGMSGSKAQEIITPKHASKIELSRSFFGNQFGYGDIIIQLDSYSHRSTYRLRNVLNPEKVIAELRARL
jgi:hypothetical protein